MKLAMQGIRSSVEGLQGSMQRVQGEVTEQCTRVKLLCSQAANLHAAADLMRAVLLRLKLVARLRACFPPGKAFADTFCEQDQYFLPGYAVKFFQ